MALVGRYNSLQVVKHTNFGLYLDGAQDGEILLPNRYIPKDIPSEDEDWLNVFIYLDSDDKLIATTEKPKYGLKEPCISPAYHLAQLLNSPNDQKTINSTSISYVFATRTPLRWPFPALQAHLSCIRQ